MKLLFEVSFALLAGLMMTRLVKKYKLPDVTSFLVAGVIIGPALLGRFGFGFTSYENIDALSVVSDAALGFIAFSMGTEFRLEALKKTGRQALVIGVIQGLVAAAMIDIVLIAIHFAMPDALSLSAAISLGAIGTATAPAATLMVVKQYHAKGEVTSLLLPIVALDDAVGLVVFAVSFGIAKAIDLGTIDITSIIVDPLVEIVISVVCGSVAGWLLTRIEYRFFSDQNRASLGVAFVFFMAAFSMQTYTVGKVEIEFSSLLVCMMMGTVFCNLASTEYSDNVMELVDRWTQPLLVLFFVISGAELELEVFKNLTVVAIGAVYIITRSIGKYVGARYSAKLVGCDKNIQKYLGYTLLPQAGVALGMCVTVQELSDGALIRNIVLFAILVYEIAGPLITKWALTKSGDIASD